METSKILSNYMFRICLVFTLSTPVTIWAANTEVLINSNNCYGALSEILLIGGYSGDLDCKSAHVKINKIGTITITPDIYTVYDLHYRTVPSPGLVAHGGQRIIIILNNKTYLGQYSLSPPPIHNISVQGNSIFIDVPAEHGNVIKIGKNGPPSTIYLDQDSIDFYK